MRLLRVLLALWLATFAALVVGVVTVVRASPDGNVTLLVPYPARLADAWTLWRLLYRQDAALGLTLLAASACALVSLAVLVTTIVLVLKRVPWRRASDAST